MGTYPFLSELSTFANGADTGKLDCSVPCLQFLYATLGIDAVGCTVTSAAVGVGCAGIIHPNTQL